MKVHWNTTNALDEQGSRLYTEQEAVDKQLPRRRKELIGHTTVLHAKSSIGTSRVVERADDRNRDG